MDQQQQQRPSADYIQGVARLSGTWSRMIKSGAHP